MHMGVVKCSRMQDPVFSQGPPSLLFRARALPVVRGPRENSVKLEHLNTPLRELSIYQINVMGKLMCRISQMMCDQAEYSLSNLPSVWMSIDG